MPKSNAIELTHVFFVDCGVEAEFQYLKNEFKDRVKVLYIYREGRYEFDKGRVQLSQRDGTIYNVTGQLHQAVDDVLLFINDWMEKGYDKFNARATSGVSKESEEHKPQS
jgi:hypothetical protein